MNDSSSDDEEDQESLEKVSTDEEEREKDNTGRLNTTRASNGHPIDVDDACDNDYFFLHAQKTHSNDDCLPTTSKTLLEK